MRSAPLWRATPSGRTYHAWRQHGGYRWYTSACGLRADREKLIEHDVPLLACRACAKRTTDTF